MEKEKYQSYFQKRQKGRCGELQSLSSVPGKVMEQSPRKGKLCLTRLVALCEGVTGLLSKGSPAGVT